jgi:hypothetical protein
MKRFGIVILSIFILYAEVAWALEQCWNIAAHADHLSSDNHHDSYSSFRHSHPSGDAASLIYCLSIDNRVGPATKTATTTLSRPIEEVSLFSSHAILPLPTGLSGQIAPVSLSRNLTFSFLAGIPHHLYLSVLHI